MKNFLANKFSQNLCDWIFPRWTSKRLLGLFFCKFTSMRFAHVSSHDVSSLLCVDLINRLLFWVSLAKRRLIGGNLSFRVQQFLSCNCIEIFIGSNDWVRERQVKDLKTLRNIFLINQFLIIFSISDFTCEV